MDYKHILNFLLEDAMCGNTDIPDEIVKNHCLAWALTQDAANLQSKVMLHQMNI